MAILCWAAKNSLRATMIFRYRKIILKGSLTRDFQYQIFFHKSVSPRPLSIPLGPFRIFSKIRGDIRE